MSGGVFLVPFLHHFKFPLSKAIAVSAFCGLPLAIIATITYMVIGLEHTSSIPYSTGYIYWPAFIGVAVMSMIFTPIGVKIAHSLPPLVLRWIFVLFLLFVGFRMIFF